VRNIRTLFPVLLMTVLGLGVGVALAADYGKVEDVRFGTDVDAQGMVPEKSKTDKFNQTAKIFVTMKVEEAKKGTEIMLSVFNTETDELAWSRAQAVPGGRAYLQFVIAPGTIPPGKYRCKVAVATDTVEDHEFEIK
jgi:hypothetical protein